MEQQQHWAALERRLVGEFGLGPNSLHGPRHWRRVGAYGLLLASRSGADVEVVRLFSLFHDSRRLNESDDPQHGPRGGELARRLCGETGQLDPNQLDLLIEACNGHTHCLSSPDPTIGSCWDADRLDLDRVGMVTEPDYFSTAYGRELAQMTPAQRQSLAGLGPFRSR